MKWRERDRAGGLSCTRDTHGGMVQKGPRMREKDRGKCREVVGGNGPYRETGTTLASAILSADDIHNHLVPLTLSCVSTRSTRVVVARTPLLGWHHVLWRRSSLPLEPKGRIKRVQELSMLLFLPPSLASSFSLRTPSTSYYISLGSLWRSLTSGISRAHSERASVRWRNEVPRLCFAVGSEREIKAGDFASFRASLLFSTDVPLSIGASCVCVKHRNFSPRKQNRRRREERIRGPKFSLVPAVLLSWIRETRDDFLFVSCAGCPLYHRTSVVLSI